MSNKLRELILVRHAKSDWKSETNQDFDRPLSAKGKKTATKVGKWLQQQDLMPDQILLSPALRTVQTFKRFCKECEIPYRLINELYLAELDTLIEVLQSAPNVKRLMVIGHNPGLEQLNRYLQGNHIDTGTELFPTCSLAHFILPQDWQTLEAGDGHLQQFIRPKDIKLSDESV